MGSNRSNTCCKDDDVVIFVLDVCQQLHNPPLTSASFPTSVTVSATQVTSAPGSSTLTDHTLTTLASEATNSDAATSRSEYPTAISRNNAVGIGVGTPLELGVIGGIRLLALQLGGKNGPTTNAELPGENLTRQTRHISSEPGYHQAQRILRGRYKSAESIEMSYARTGSQHGSYNGRYRYYERYTAAPTRHNRPREEL